MSKPTLKELRDSAQTMIGNGVRNKEALLAALPALIALKEATQNNNKLVKACQTVVEELSDACSQYALRHPGIFDNELKESDRGTRTGDLTIENVTYHFVNGIGTPKREDGQNMSQMFLAALPKEWTKAKLEANLANVSDADLEKKGLYRPAKNSWEVVC